MWAFGSGYDLPAILIFILERPIQWLLLLFIVINTMVGMITYLSMQSQLSNFDEMWRSHAQISLVGEHGLVWTSFDVVLHACLWSPQMILITHLLCWVNLKFGLLLWLDCFMTCFVDCLLDQKLIGFLFASFFHLRLMVGTYLISIFGLISGWREGLGKVFDREEWWIQRGLFGIECKIATIKKCLLRLRWNLTELILFIVCYVSFLSCYTLHLS